MKMHLSDDEYESLRPYHIVSYRPKKSSKKKIQTIGFIIVLIILAIIYSNVKTSRVNIDATLYNKTYLQIINESIQESRRFRKELLKNFSGEYSTGYGVTLSLKNYPPGLVEARNHVRELFEKIVDEPISKLKLNYNFSNEFYESNGGKNYDSVQRINNYKNSETTCKGRDWVSCNGFQCQVVKEVLDKMPMISCYYNDIVYINDNNYYIDTDSYRVDGNETYIFINSDHVKIFCDQFGNNHLRYDFRDREFWIGIKTGFRPVYVATPYRREGTPNVLILALDSIPYSKFLNYLPHAFAFLTQDLKAVVLQNYNVKKSSTSTAFDVILKKVGFKTPDTQKMNRNIYLYPDDSLITRLHDDGYYTAYFTDFPMVSSNNNKFKSDFKLNHFFEENDKIWREDRVNITFSNENCVGDTPKYVLLMNITDQYTQMPVKRFSFTLISNITNYPRWAVEDNLINFLKSMRSRLENTLLILMTTQIFPKASKSTSNVEDFNQLVFIVLPHQLIEQRPEARKILMVNSGVSTTPFDIDATILDAVGLHHLGSYDKVTDSELPKGRSLLEVQHNMRRKVTLNPVPPTF